MKLTVEIPALTADQLADLFCQLDDSQQAAFFLHVAKHSAVWPLATMQWHMIGRQLKKLETESEEGRSGLFGSRVVQEIAAAIE